MNNEEEVILLERPVIFIEADELVDDHVGSEDVTTEYVLAQVDDDYDEVVVEQPDEVFLVDIEHLAAMNDESSDFDDDATLELKVA